MKKIILSALFALLFTSTPATAGSITLTESPSEVTKGNLTEFNFAVQGVTNELSIMALLKKDGAILGWLPWITELQNGRGRIRWVVSSVYALPVSLDFKIAAAGEGYSVIIGILRNDFGLGALPAGESNIIAETFVHSVETPRFTLKPNVSNLFIRQYSYRYRNGDGVEVTPLEFYILEKPGKRFLLQESTNLMSWTSLPGADVTTNSDFAEFGFAIEVNPDHRFYRAVFLP